MGWLDKLLGKEGAPDVDDVAFETEQYKGFSITPTPREEGGQYRITGVIRLGEQEHLFIRSDMIPSAQECASLTVRKAKKLIDEQGEKLF